MESPTHAQKEAWSRVPQHRTASWTTWNSFQRTGVPSPAVPRSQWLDVLWLAHVWPHDQAVQAVRQALKEGLRRKDWASFQELVRIRQQPELVDQVKGLDTLKDFFRLPSPEEETARQTYLGLGEVLGPAHPGEWVAWSRSILAAADDTAGGAVALCRNSQPKLPTRLRQWLGGWDLTAWLARHPLAVVAGGSVVAAELEVEQVRRGSDVDVFILQEDRKTMTDLFETFRARFPHSVFVVHSATVVDVVSPACQATLQVILCSHHSPGGLVNQFDLDYVKTYFDGHAVWQTPECVLAWRDKTVRRTTRSAVSSWRLEKAGHKGFAVKLSPLVEETTEEKAFHARWRYYRHQAGEPLGHVQAIWTALCPGARVSETPNEAMRLLQVPTQGQNVWKQYTIDVPERNPEEKPWEHHEGPLLRPVQQEFMNEHKKVYEPRVCINVEVVLPYVMFYNRFREKNLYCRTHFVDVQELSTLKWRLVQELGVPEYRFCQKGLRFFVSDSTEWYSFGGNRISEPRGKMRTPFQRVRVQARVLFVMSRGPRSDTCVVFQATRVWCRVDHKCSFQNRVLHYYSSETTF